MATTPYAGTSAFFKNRAGNHNWLDNNARPMLNVVITDEHGKRRYIDLFRNDKASEIKVSKAGKVTLTFDSNIAQPLFRVLDSKS